MKDYQVTITNCIVMNLLEEVEQPCSKLAIKTQAVKLLDQCGNISQQAKNSVFNAIDQYTNEELEELANRSADCVIEAYEKVARKEMSVIDGTLDNTPHQVGKIRNVQETSELCQYEHFDIDGGQCFPLTITSKRISSHISVNLFLERTKMSVLSHFVLRNMMNESLTLQDLKDYLLKLANDKGWWCSIGDDIKYWIKNFQDPFELIYVYPNLSTEQLKGSIRLL